MDTDTHSEITTSAKIKALARELALRRATYAKLVYAGRMHQATADYEIAVMQAILDDYLWEVESIRPRSAGNCPYCGAEPGQTHNDTCGLKNTPWSKT